MAHPYISQNAGGVFGSQYQYNSTAEKVIDEAAECIRKCSDEKLTAVFNYVITGMWTVRKELAETTNTPNDQDFCQPRFAEAQSTVVDVTKIRKGLYGVYQGVLASRIAPYVDKLQPNLVNRDFNYKKLVVESGKVMEYPYKIIAEVFSKEKTDDEIALGRQDFTDILELMGIKTQGLSQDAIKNRCEEAIKDKQSLSLLKQKNMKLYQKIVLFTVFQSFSASYPSFQNGQPVWANMATHYIVVTHRIAFDPKKLMAVSRYLIPANFGNYSDGSAMLPSRWMTAFPPPGYLIHQDQFLIPDTLRHLGQLFAKAIRSKKLEELKQCVALWRWTYANCMPCKRGDGAVGDWIERAIYKAKGYSAQHTEVDSVLPNIEPLAKGPKQYLDEYEKTITVTSEPTDILLNKS